MAQGFDEIATGLTPRWKPALARSPFRRHRALLPARSPASALDSVIVRLTSWYGKDAADLIALGMEYPLDHRPVPRR
ncbi:MAG: hypothetical protein ABI601_09580 [bacterium]